MSLGEFSKRSKKLIASGLAAGMLLGAGCMMNLAPLSVNAADVTLGDVDGSGKVELKDASLALKLALGIETPTEEYVARGDVNYDGKIGLDDVTTILKAALGIVTIEPSEAPVVSDKPAFTVPPKPTVSAPVVVFTPAPTSIPLPMPNPGEPVEGTKIQALSTEAMHGAEYNESTGVYTFTEANATAKRGITFQNPWAGKTELRQTVEDALPMFLVNSKGAAEGKIEDGKLLALDGSKTVLGELREKGAEMEAVKTETDGTQTVVASGKAVKWHEDLLPLYNNLDSKIQYIPELAELYARPEWSNGLSISFWCKYDWTRSGQSDASPMLVIKNSAGCDNEKGGEFAKAGHTGDFAFMLRLNGGVSLEGDESGNCFRAENCVAGEENEWNYFTVTFANDWITVYVNGRELVYYDLFIDKDDIGYFNNGFLTRYSPANEVAKSEVTDVRNYLKKGWMSKSGTDLEVLDKECCIIGNSRYKNPDAVTKKKNSNLPYDLLIDMLTKETTEIWFGSSSETQCVCLTSDKSLGTTTYKLKNGTQLLDVTCYDKELQPEEVIANYAKEYPAVYKKLGLEIPVGK